VATGEPRRHMDFITPRVPSFFATLIYVHEFVLPDYEVTKLAASEIAREMHEAAQWYVNDRLYQDAYYLRKPRRRNPIKANYPMRRLSTKGFARRPQGNQSQPADWFFICRMAHLVQQIKGHNATIGWVTWNDYEQRYVDTELTRFCLDWLRFIDRQRKPDDLPKGSFFKKVKKAMGLSTPR
jgi:hypothetical protein